MCEGWGNAYARVNSRRARPGGRRRGGDRDTFIGMDADHPRIVRERMPLAEVSELAQRRFGVMVKAAVDVGRRIMAIGGELHADEEALLLGDGSVQDDIWGINLYPGETGEEWIEFDSMINIRPSQGNRSRTVEDQELRARIRFVVDALIDR